MLSVTFASNEDAADFGGPRREFFRLLVKAIFQDSGAFEGNKMITLKLRVELAFMGKLIIFSDF